MSRITTFVVGVIAGVYLDQSHKMPNIERWVSLGVRTIKEWEERNRK
jgi:hypothetical protein